VANTLGVAINSADQIFDTAGELTDDMVQRQLELLAAELPAIAHTKASR
jgi:FMN reductase